MNSSFIPQPAKIQTNAASFSLSRATTIGSDCVLARDAIGGCLTLEDVYLYEPIPAELDAATATHILGAQGQLWSEYLPDTVHLEYMAFPRACAFAERLWSARENRDFADFAARLRGHLRLLDRMDVNYRALKS